MEEDKSAFKILTVHLQERDLQEGLGIDGRKLLEWILKKYSWVSIQELS